MEQLTTGRISLRRTGTYAGAPVAGFVTALHSNHGPIRENGSEISDPHLTMCVELIGQRGELERFCEGHGDLLGGKVIVYKHLEHWSIALRA